MNADSYWDPFSAISWAKLLGLTHENLFGHVVDDEGRTHSVLLDGRAASFEFSHVKDPYFEGDEALSWTWSANMRHCVIVNEVRERLLLRRWDRPSEIQQFKIPTRQGAHNLLNMMHNSKSPRSPDVINWVLELFKYLLANLHNPSYSLSALNRVLIIAREHSLGRIPTQHWHSTTLLDSIYSQLPMSQLENFDGANRRERQLLSYCLDYLFEGPAQFGLAFKADLLFRHAASQLYQQAHLVIERDAQQYLPGLAPEPRFLPGPKEVRYTPNNLARSLVQQGLRSLLKSQQIATIDVFDPSCGSGIFLQECIRECDSKQFSAVVNLRGSDISAIAVQISNSCLQMAVSEAGAPENYKPQVTQGDSLTIEWPNSDLILMNPPFCSWQNMSESEREAVTNIVSDIGARRTDKAMAFVWKAVQSLRPAGVLAAVLPRALLDNQNAADLRSEIGNVADIVMLGRFEGFSYFEHSLVETAFMILQKHANTQASPPVRILIADKGWEDASLRLLRGADPTDEELGRVEIFEARADLFQRSNWMPRRMSEMALLEELESRDFPPIESLFEVQQGIRTGSKSAFLLSFDDISTLPSVERKYFRKAAGQGTILQGSLIPSEFVFYPYNPSGPLFSDEAALRRKVPTYFERWLQPLEEKLRKRPWAPTWWLPERPRQWQFEHRQKIVSTYFGKPGAFAYDAEGDYVVVEGFAWNWIHDDPNLANGDSVPFYDTLLPYAYLALLNSEVFERIVACFSWRLQGGQLRLERRFLSKVPLPNLATDSQLSRTTVQNLIKCGEAIANGELESNLETVNDLSAEAYQLRYAFFERKS